MKPKKSAALPLVLTLMTMLSASCSPKVNCRQTCLVWPVGGKPVGEVYKRLNPADKAVMNEWFNRLYKLKSHPAFCNNKLK